MMRPMSDLNQYVEKISRDLQFMQPGSLAELRRMIPGDVGTAEFWRIAAELHLPLDRTDIWQRIIRIMAILAPKGDPVDRKPLHGRRRKLGETLCDGGDPGWPNGEDARPMLSETRLARFLALPPERRGEALERIARNLAVLRRDDDPVDCVALVRLLLYPEDPKTMRDLAYAYYRRLDARRSPTQQEGNG